MARIITQAGDPTLWNTLNEMWLAEDRPGWLTTGTVHWKVVENTNAVNEFHEQETIDLLDSRSVIGSKPASYADLE